MTVPRKGGRRKKKGPRVTKERMLKAIPGTCGRWTYLAERMRVTVETCQGYLNPKRKGWEEVRAAWQYEKERLGDIAEQTVEDVMKQRLDIGSASIAARWYLEKKHKDRGYGNERTVTLEGGKKPIQIEQTVVPVDKLNLSLEERKRLLAAIEAAEIDDEEDPE